MKRLLAYLFIVLGLGLVFSVNSNAEKIHLECNGFKGIGSYRNNNMNLKMEFKIDTQKKTYEYLIPSKSYTFKKEILILILLDQLVSSNQEIFPHHQSQ